MRHLWQLFEPLHAVTYFAPEARAAYEEAGLRGYWRGYFAGRAAPLGAVPAAPVTALFFSFAPSMVERALPDVWRRASPERALAARLDGAVAALRTLTADVPGAWPASQAGNPPGGGAGPATGTLLEAADLLETVARAAVTDGRALAAANAALPRPADPVGRLWLAATVLREHRGDGHITALVDAGLSGCEALVLRDALHGGRADLQPHRGWTDDQWDAAAETLKARGWLRADGTASAAGKAAHEDVESRTDRLAAPPWEALTADQRARLAEVLTPLAVAAAAVVPYPNTMGLPRPGQDSSPSSS